MIDLPVYGPHYKFAQTDPEGTTNYYPEIVGSDPKTGPIYTLRCTPGLVLHSEIPGSGGIRALHVMFFQGQEILLAARGNGAYRWRDVDGVFTWTEIGLLTSTAGRLQISDNGYQAIFVEEGGAFGYDPADETWEPPNGFQGGLANAVFSTLRIISPQPGTGKFWVSEQDDVFEWNPLAGSEADSFADPIVRIAAVGKILYILGSRSMEVWQSFGYNEFPFRRVYAGVKIGCAAPASVVTFGESVYFLGSSPEGRGIVYRTRGTALEPISDTRTTQLIQAMPSIDDCTAFAYQEQGHPFVVFNFGVGDKTLVYDISSEKWHERNRRNPVTGIYSRRPETFQAFYGTQNLVGDFRDGKVYELTRKAFTDNGDPVVRERVFPVWPIEQVARTPVPPFALFLDMGNTPVGEEAPEVMLDWSDDRGRTYGQPVVQKMSDEGQYFHRLVWNGMGTSWGRAFRVRMTGNQDFVVRRVALLDEMLDKARR